MLPRLLLICALGFGLAPASIAVVHAQGVEQGIDIDIESSLFPNNKKGCEMRAGFNYAMVKSFQNGDSPSSVANFKMLEPLITKVFETVRTSGVSQAHINSITEYQACVKNSEPVRNADKELLLVSKHTSCGKFSDVVLGTLDGIKTRQKLETVQARYANEKIDFIDTGYEDLTLRGEDLPETALQDPVSVFIKSLYDVAQKRSYDDAVEQGAGLVVGCFTGR